jgi:hypothetical protein
MVVDIFNEGDAALKEVHAAQAPLALTEVLKSKGNALKKPHFSFVGQAILASMVVFLLCVQVPAYYTTKGTNFIDRATGDSVVLKGFGLGCWLLPEGYMWGIRKIDRPRQFEAAITDLIGADSAKQFWRLYYKNFLTEDDVRMMSSWGATAVRLAINANVVQPRDNQPQQPPYVYDESGWALLDSFVEWCGRSHMGIIWDMHGAPGAQNRDNFSDSDGDCRLWTEKDTYWPRCIDLWFKIADRYKASQCIIGYDLLNEPNLAQNGMSTSLLRELYVKLTDTIRTVDTLGVMFVEGDDYAQTFTLLEPINWDKHLAVAFHSYPPTSNASQLLMWDTLRTKYNIPLWHGETGEQGPPYELNKTATTFLNSANVGWSFWTHKKFDLLTQPWNCHRTPGFDAILSYWNGTGPAPRAPFATAWLFDQAKRTHTDYCDFLPDMVRSLVPLNPDAGVVWPDTVALSIVQQPLDASVEEGGSASFRVYTHGHPASYQWYKNGAILASQTFPYLQLSHLAIADSGSRFFAVASNARGAVKSDTATLSIVAFSGPTVPRTGAAPVIDGLVDTAWNAVQAFPVTHMVQGSAVSPGDIFAAWRAAWDDANLYLLVQVIDNVLKNTNSLSYENDGIEAYIDIDNSKSFTYGTGDFQVRYGWNAGAVENVQGAIASRVSAAQKNTANGYVMEMALPWSALGVSPQPGMFMGFDVHVNDNDSLSRKTKLAWFGQSDNAWQSPRYFGTIRLGAGTGALHIPDRRVSGKNAFSVEKRGTWLLCSMPQKRQYRILLSSVNGRTVYDGRAFGTSFRLDARSLTKGVYLARIFGPGGSLVKKMVIAQ